MKIQFGKNDSIYKIVQTLKKVPNYKKVTVDIHPDHRIFEHQRRSNYLENLINELHLDVTFVSYTIKTKRYRQATNLHYVDEQLQNWWTKLKNLKNIFNDLNGFHKNLLLKKNYFSGFVLLAELWVLITLLYVFWTLISPNTTITINPSYQIENVVYNFRYFPVQDKQVHQFQSYLSLPYYIWNLPYKYTMSLNVQNIKYSQKPASGTIQINNTYSYTYSLLDNSTLVTDEWVLYKTQNRIDVPAGSEDNPWTARIRVVAEPTFEDGQLIWSLWNIPKGKLLYFKNLDTPEWEQPRVRASAWRDFSGWETIETGTVIEEDVAQIEKDIVNNMEREKVNFLKTNIQWDPDLIVLPYEDLYSYEINELITTSEVWEQTSFVEWKVETQLYYPYIYRSDLRNWVEQFLEQRSEDDIHINQYDRNWITMYDRINIQANEKLPFHYIIPTKIPVIKTYNISKDALWVVNEIKDRIVWLDSKAAKDIILSYDEIDAAKISISPRRYSTIPAIKSRIRFKIDE